MCFLTFSREKFYIWKYEGRREWNASASAYGAAGCESKKNQNREFKFSHLSCAHIQANESTKGHIGKIYEVGGESYPNTDI